MLPYYCGRAAEIRAYAAHGGCRAGNNRGSAQLAQIPETDDTLTAGFPDASISMPCELSTMLFHLRELEAFRRPGAAAACRRAFALATNGGAGTASRTMRSSSFYVLNRSLIPINMIDVFNFGRPRGRSVILGQEQLAHPKIGTAKSACICIC